MSEANTQVNVASQPNVAPTVNPPPKNLATMNVDNQNTAFNIIMDKEKDNITYPDLIRYGRLWSQIL